MDICENRGATRWSMTEEVKNYIDVETLKNAQYPEDYINEVADSLVPVYNAELIDFASHYSGEEYWSLWNEENFGETPLDMLRSNVFALYQQVAFEVWEDYKQTLEEEE